MKDRTLGDGIARQELNLLFVIDNSGSMEGEKIGAVNNAIRDVMTIMPEIQEDTSDAIIKISALKFSDKAEWIYTEPIALNISGKKGEYVIEILAKADGIKAFKVLP